MRASKRKIAIAAFRCALIATLIIYGQLAGAVMTKGAAPCGEWLESRQAQTALPDEYWLLGYLSGLALGTGLDVLNGVKSASLAAWVDNYCKQYPLENLSTAGSKLFDELKARYRR